MLVASIHDGDFLDCTASLPQCILPTSLPLLRESTKFAPATTTVLTRSSISKLSDSEQAQLSATLRLNYSEADAPTVESAIDLTDGGHVNQLVFHELETGRALVIYEHRAGDTSVGAVFERDALTIQAEISDGAFQACQLFAQH